MPNYELLIEALLRHGSQNLSSFCTISPGYPVKPMLANPAKDLQQIFIRHSIGDIICEYKYDGERAQIHRTETGKVMVFSRNQENNTEKYPDIVHLFTQLYQDEQHSDFTFILDCEVVAWDSQLKKILPFQALTNRKRKAVAMQEITIEICLFAFDLLYLNGKSLLSSNLSDRRKILLNTFCVYPGKFRFAESLIPKNRQEIITFLDQAVSDQCEGIMIKSLTLEATYEIAKRSHSWYKFKKDYVNNLGDTVDLVVMGGYCGKGRRSGACGAYLLGCYDTTSEEYQSICKIGTGFTDESLSSLDETLGHYTTEKPDSLYKFHSSLACDRWFSPSCVWEVKAADLTISPVHFAAFGYVNPTKGISLRFPRFIRERTDKLPEDATSSQQIAEMYQNQAILIAEFSGDIPDRPEVDENENEEQLMKDTNS